jgi:sodium transport system permease protein
LQRLVQYIYPMNQSIIDELNKLMASGQKQPWWLMLIAIAVLPAICEELAFRGFILSGFRHLGHKWRAIVLASIFFGVTHAIFQQSIVACLVGMMIGYIAVQTGSLFPGMIFHLVNNSYVLLRIVVTEDWVKETAWAQQLLQHSVIKQFFVVTADEGLTFTRLSVGISAVATAAILYWFHRLPYARSSEESLQEAIDTADTPEAEMSVTS